MQPISRFQAAAVGHTIYIHTHRSLNDILVLDVADPDKPRLKQVPVSSATGATPSARCLLIFVCTNSIAFASISRAAAADTVQKYTCNLPCALQCVSGCLCSKLNFRQLNEQGMMMRSTELIGLVEGIGRRQNRLQGVSRQIAWVATPCVTTTGLCQ